MDYQRGIGNGVIEWPYPIKYGTVNHVTVDVLVIGCGAAGASAGISAARRGLKVAAVDKAPIKHSGNTGAGMDHWNMTVESPSNPFTAEQIAESTTFFGGRKRGSEFYIALKGTWEALLELEKLGMPVRDIDGDYDGLPTKDPATGFLRAFDYDKVSTVKLRGGQYMKPVLFEGLRNLGVDIYERVMMTKLLTKDAKQGSPVVGAIGVSLETGEAYVFHTKSVVLGTGGVSSVWMYSTELTGSSAFWDPNEIGEGVVMALNAGAMVCGFEGGGKPSGRNPTGWPCFGVGNGGNTWYPCTIVDNTGKKVPWFRKDDGTQITDFKDLFKRDPTRPPVNSDREDAQLDPQMVEKIKSGEYQLPFWADLSDVPEDERRSIWGIMIGNEGKTRYAVFDYYTRCGFNPDKDLLWAPIKQPESFRGGPSYTCEPNTMKLWRSEGFSRGDVVTDWNLMSTVPGLFAAGTTCGMEGCSYACSTGFYAGNRAAEYSAGVERGEIDQAQMDAELARIWAPVERFGSEDAYVSWKEMWGGTTRVMQSCCGEWKDKSVLEFGLFWLDSIARNEMNQTYARNPHELGRVLECATRMRSSEMFLRAAIGKIDKDLEVFGGDPGTAHPPAGKKSYEFMFNYFENDEFKTVFKDDQYWLQKPNLPGYLENYERCRANEGKALV